MFLTVNVETGKDLIEDINIEWDPFDDGELHSSDFFLFISFVIDSGFQFSKIFVPWLFANVLNTGFRGWEVMILYPEVSTSVVARCFLLL